MQGLEFVKAYIDGLLILSTKTWEDHLYKLDTVFTWLGEAGLKLNGNKSFFGRSEIEHLGFWITRAGIQPIPKKVNAIRDIATPKTVRDVRKFVGMVNYYRDMWIRRSYVLAPLTKLCGKGTKFSWGNKQQTAFDTMDKIDK